MGFTYTDSTKVVLEAFGRFKVTLLEAVVPGDLLNWYNTDNAYTAQFADQSDSQPADCIAMEAGDAGAEITACLKAVLGTKSTIATGGVVTRVYFAGASDFFGAPLYLGEDGKPSSTAGTTTNQPVGRLLARDRILIDLAPTLLGSMSIAVTDSVGGKSAISVNDIFTLATAGAHKAGVFVTTYTPATSGFATPIGLVGKVVLAAGKTFTGGQGAMYGVQGQLDFQHEATVNQANAIFAALRGVITIAGTPVFSDFGTIAGLYVDNLCSINLAGISTYTEFGSSLASFQNHGGTLDHAIVIRGGNKITNVFSFASMGGGAIVVQDAKAGVGANMKVLVDETTYYIRMNQA